MQPRLAELLTYLELQRHVVSQAILAVPSKRLRESPGSGRWSAVEVVEHLAVVDRRIAGRFEAWTTEARATGTPAETDATPILPTIDTTRVVKRATRTVAPEAIRPKGTMEMEQAWREFDAADREVRRVVAAADGLALAQVVRPHPVLGPIHLYEWIAFIGAHRARHAGQIHETAEALLSRRLWTKVDDYISASHVASDAVLDAALAASADAGLPAIQVAPNQGRLLQIYARMVDAHAILEIGTLGGYSTIWLARGLAPGGRLVTLEADPKHADVARANIARAGLSEVVDIRVGPALESLPGVAGMHDLIFIDADKPNIPRYFEWALRLCRPGGVIIVDNVIRDGHVIDSDSPDPNVQGVRRFNDLVAREPRVLATTLQTVGSKGYDGFCVAFVRA